MPTCGAVIQPIAVSVVSTASPVAAAAQAAMPPVTASGRAGRAAPPATGTECSPEPAASGSPGSGAGRAAVETLTRPILTTIPAPPKQARRAQSGQEVTKGAGGLGAGVWRGGRRSLQRVTAKPEQRSGPAQRTRASRPG